MDAANLRSQADQLDADADAAEANGAAIDDRINAAMPLAEPVDTTAARAAIDEARALLERFARKEARDKLVADFEALKVQSEAFTSAIGARAVERSEALATAEMPVPGLSLARRCDAIPGDESEDLLVVFEGEPFAQASSAQQLRVSMRLAMTANPKLRIMLIKDGSLLDPNGLAIVRELAVEGDYQVWLESVGEGDGTGIIMEAGAVRGAPEPAKLDPPKRRKAKVEGEDTSAAVASDAEVRAASEPRNVNAPDRGAPPPFDPAQDGPTLREQRARRSPAAMRATPTPKPGDLFGGDS